MDNLSVIIRCRNEERYIGYAIQSVIDNFNNPEIIVINNNSTDRSMSIVNLFKKDSSLANNSGNYADIDVYNMDGYSPGKSLNYGIKQCVNKTVLVMSAHCVLQKQNLELVKLQLQDHCVVGGKQIPIYKGKKITPRYVWSHYGNGDKVNLFSESEDRHFLHNAFAYYQRQTLIDNPFDEELASKEERYWVNDMIKDGHTSYYNSSISCEHHYTTNGATWKGIG